MKPKRLWIAVTSCLLTIASGLVTAAAEELPPYLADRGTGVSLSQFGTYVRRGEVIVYPFFEYYRDDDLEYQPDEFGYMSAEELRGKYRASEGLLFLGYGLTDNLAVEFEAAWISASLNRSPNDSSGLPSRIEESGLGDVEGQLRWRMANETEGRPEFFALFETVFPTADEGSLIGTSDWQLKFGLGLIKGFHWGTVTLRGSTEYDAGEKKLDSGEYAVEYLKRLSSAWRVFLAIEGGQDEVGLITELQWHLSERAFVKLNNGFGLTSKATDWAPEVGVVFRF